MFLPPNSVIYIIQYSLYNPILLLSQSSTVIYYHLNVTTALYEIHLP